MHKIVVRLPMDRDYAGLLEVQTPGGTRIAGPYEACGRADDRLARDHRNPERDPLLPFGDIPCGEYWVAGIEASGVGTEYDGDEFGPAGVVVLEPRNGDAALADANGRFRFLIHGGKTAAGGGLRPTDGSLRLSNRDQRDLVGVLRRLEGSTGTCLVVQVEHLRTRRVATSLEVDDPHFAKVVSALTLSSLSRRTRMLGTFWLRAMMGATGALVAVRSALGFSLGNTPSDASGNLRSALQAKGSASGLSGKPHFTRGRLYALSGGDYTQPAPEQQAPAPEQQTQPAPEEQAPAPAPDTNAMDQLKSTEQSSQQATQAPTDEEAKEKSGQGFDTGGQPAAPASPPPATPAPVEQPTEQDEEQTPSEPEPEEETPTQQNEEETPTPQEEETPAPQEEEQETPAPQEQQEEPAPTPSAPVYQAPAPRPVPAAPSPATPTMRTAPTAPAPRPMPAAPAAAVPMPSAADPIIAGMAALALQLGWTVEQRNQLTAALNALDFRRSGLSSQDIADTWRTVIIRGQDPKLAKEAAAGQGLGFPGAGKQTVYQDCTIFALANAAGLPYGVVAARATKLISEGSWRSTADRANPEGVIENQGLNGGEVVMLGASFGQVKVIEGPQFADSLRQGHPVMLDVMPYNGVSRGAGHEVVLTRTFQHNGETWYAMMDSNYGPYTSFFLSAKELDILRQENGVSYSPNPGTTPSLLR